MDVIARDHQRALRAIRVRQVSDAAGVEVSAGLAADDVGDSLDALTDAGLAQRTGSGWELSPRGVIAADDLQRLPDDLLDAAPYHRFAVVNDRFKRACSAVQTSARSATDGLSDAVVVEVGACHAEVDGLLVELADHMVLADRYRSRLASCMEDVRRHDRASLLSPLRESVHSIWMELHEDLLLTFGQERDEDG